MMRFITTVIFFAASLLLSFGVHAQSSARIKPLPPKKGAATAENTPLNPKMFIMLIQRIKYMPVKPMEEYVGKEYSGKIPQYNLQKLDPDLFKVFKSPNLSVLANQPYLFAVEKEVLTAQTIKVSYPPIKFPPPEVDPVTTLPMRTDKAPGNGRQGGVNDIKASTVAVPKVAVPVPDADPALAVNKNGNTNLAERTPLPSKRKSAKKGYKNIVYEKPVTREIAKEEPSNTKTPVKENVTQVNKQPAFSPDATIIYDTGHVSRHRRVEEEMVVTSHHDTIYIVPGDYEDTYVETAVKPEVRPSIASVGTCKCVEMVMTAQDTIDYEDYVNYGFSFKNNCKENVYIHSFSFRFSINEITGYPAKRIRRVDFVKRFDYPEFVKIRAGQSYDYHFADDPFFEYELVKGRQYKFTFMYNNVSNRNPVAPQQTHICTDPREKVIYVQ